MSRVVFATLRRRWLRALLVGSSTLLAFVLLGFFLAIRHGFAVGLTQVGADLLSGISLIGKSSAGALLIIAAGACEFRFWSRFFHRSHGTATQ